MASEDGVHSLPMLTDRKTEMYIKFAKVMVLFQGPYTKSRSKDIEGIQSKFKYAAEVISDETYQRHRRTICSFDKTEEFYEYFCTEVQTALEEGNNLVVLDPTMSNEKQNQFYLALAYRMQYVFLVYPPWCIIQSGGRVNHSWPPRSLADSFERKGTFIQGSNGFKHLFCGWYLHDVDSVELRHVGKLFAQDCLEEIPEFLNVFSRVCPDNSLEDDSPQGKCSVDSFAKHFNLDDSRQDLAYCVVKIFESDKSMNEFFKEPSVTKIYGKTSKLYISGFVISPHMIAARVKLTRMQKEVWDMPEELDERMCNRPCASELVEQSKENLPDVSNVRLISSKSNQTVIADGEHCHRPLEAIYPNAKGRSCHIVLGKAQGAPRKNVDYDVAFALKRERNVKKEDLEIMELENCVVKRLGKYWIVYLRQQYVVNGIFASCVKPSSFEKAIN